MSSISWGTAVEILEGRATYNSWELGDLHMAIERQSSYLSSGELEYYKMKFEDVTGKRYW